MRKMLMATSTTTDEKSSNPTGRTTRRIGPITGSVILRSIHRIRSTGPSRAGIQLRMAWMTMMAEKIRNTVARTIPMVMGSMVAGRRRTDGKASLC